MFFAFSRRICPGEGSKSWTRGLEARGTRSFGGEDDRLRESTIRLKPERGEGGTESEVRKRAALEGAILFVLMLT